MDEWLWLVVILGLAVPMYTSWEAIGFVDRGVQEEQGQFEHGQDYDPRRVRLAIVHARQDIVGLYFLLGRLWNARAVNCAGRGPRHTPLVI